MVAQTGSPEGEARSANSGLEEITIGLDDKPHPAPGSAERTSRNFSMSLFSNPAKTPSSRPVDNEDAVIKVLRRSSFGCNLDSGVHIQGLEEVHDDTGAGDNHRAAELEDVDAVLKDLSTENGMAERPLHRKRRDLARVLLYEFRDNGDVTRLTMSIRELYIHVSKLVHRYQSPSSPSGYSSTTDVELFSSTSSYSTTTATGGSGKRATSPSDLMRSPNQNQLHHRDLRQLFSTNAASQPVIAVRKHAVLVNLEALRSIVLVDRLLLLVDPGMDQILMSVERELAAEKDEVAEFEMRAYETLLKISLTDLAKEVKDIEPRVSQVVKLMETGSHAATSASANDKFRHLMNRVSELDSRAQARRRALTLVLEEDEDLALMNLTKMKANPMLYKMPLAPEVADDHEEVELLLESYLQEINSLTNVLEIMRDRMRNTEALIMVKLDIARNRLLTASTIFALVAMCLSLGAVVTGIFGMNLNSYVQEEPHWFNTVAIGLLIVCPGSALLTYAYFSWKGVWVS